MVKSSWISPMSLEKKTQDKLIHYYGMLCLFTQIIRHVTSMEAIIKYSGLSTLQYVAIWDRQCL
jgi:hypothetical protein